MVYGKASRSHLINSTTWYMYIPYHSVEFVYALITNESSINFFFYFMGSPQILLMLNDDFTLHGGTLKKN